MVIRQALISVSSKEGIVEFARALSQAGVNIISSGGTAKTLQDNAIPCREISEVTGFPEILDGRVKTLNPKIHGGILARRDKKTHLDELHKHGIAPIDLVVVNLYPFEATIEKLTAAGPEVPEEAVENIDIGGVALLRAAGKNFADVLVVCDPSDYPSVVEKIRNNGLTLEFRKELAARAFRHTAYYDALISGYLTGEKFPQETALPLKKLSSLRYGENPHQEAALYRQGPANGAPGVVEARQLQGKELSYNNYLDLESAWRLAQEFETPACVIVKHSNPCGCAQGPDIGAAYLRALACDPVSAFGGIIAFNREVDDTTAREVVKLFTECIIAPAYSDKAKEVFLAKKNLRLLLMPAAKAARASKGVEYRTISGGMLVQDRDNALLSGTKTATRRAPTKEEMDSLQFAWKVCKHVKSNAIILVRGTQTVGVGAGQMSRIDSLKIAESKMKAAQHGLDEKKNPLVLASDAFFPFNDVVLEAAKTGVSAIAQPGGSIRDEDSIKAADENNMAMVMTGMRHFRH
ncbi:MAG: bifunctional phosphoribosylaminoimidazolecarboxamide formyltransferase/IMP cyclohydrolase [Endomicrobiales bacterium]